MNVALIRHLGRSPAVRRALLRDSCLYFIPLLMIVGVKLMIANSQGTSILAADRLADMALLVSIWVLMWLLAVIRTLRKALRDEQLLAR